MHAEELKKLLDYHDNLYYNQDSPEISDVEYDALKARYLELTGLEEYNYVPGEAMFNKVEHTTPILSLDKVQITDKDKLRAEINRLWPVVIEPKFDGLTVVAYPGRKFVTRGDGKIGEDVSSSCEAISCLDDIDPYPSPVRMEVLMPISVFNELNREREEQGLKLYENPRNAAAGMLRNLDKSKIKGLTAYIYEIIGDTQAHTRSLWELEEQDCGEITTPRWSFSNVYGSKEAGVEAAMNFIEEFDRTKLDYEIDGLVIKSDIPNSLKKFGMTGHHPKNAIAVKFEAQGEWTKLKSVTWQVGKTGIIAPVGEIEPIRILGSTINRATLHNISIINALNIRINERVFVVKANDVIPKVVKGEHKVTRDTFPIIPPKECPVCGAPTEFKNNILYCTGEECDAQELGKTIKLSSREALNITGLSKETIIKMMDYCEVKSFDYDFTTPLYFDKEDILKLPGFAEKSAEKLYNSIQKSKQTELKRFILAANIPLIGKSASEDIANTVRTLDNLIKEVEIGYKTIASIEKIGPKMIASLNKYGAERFGMLWEAGVRPSDVTKVAKKVSNSDVKTFVITGSFDIPRKEIEQMIKDAGHKTSGSVSSKTSYLLASPGEEGTTKYIKATDLGTPIINSLDELKEIING